MKASLLCFCWRISRLFSNLIDVCLCNLRTAFPSQPWEVSVFLRMAFYNWAIKRNGALKFKPLFLNSGETNYKRLIDCDGACPRRQINLPMARGFFLGKRKKQTKPSIPADRLFHNTSPVVRGEQIYIQKNVNCRWVLLRRIGYTLKHDALWSRYGHSWFTVLFNDPRNTPCSLRGCNITR